MSNPALTELLAQALESERHGRFNEACDLLRNLAGIETSAITLDARLRLARLLIQAGHQHEAEAEELLAEARRLAEEAGTTHHAAGAIHLLALLERKRGNTDVAQRLLEQSPVRNQRSAPGATLGQWFHYRALIEVDRGDLNYGERLLFRAHQVYREIHHDTGLSEVCDSLANLLLMRGKSRAARRFAEMSLNLKREFGDRYGEALTLGTLGRSHLLQARYDLAAIAFAQDLAIARELGDTRGVGIMLNSLGEACLLQKDLDEAARYYEQSLAADCGPINAIHAHLGLARVHLAAGRTSQAGLERDHIASLCNELPQAHALADALVGLRGSIAWREGDTIEGKRLLLEAIEALSRRNQPLDTIPFLYELRDLHQSRGDTAAAVKAMIEAIDLLSECGDERGIQDIEEWLRTTDAPGLTRLALERHLPGHLVDDILSGRMRRQESRKQEITVLFSDIRGYTTLTEGMAAEDVVELLNEWFAEATRVIRRHGGLVDKFIGDAVMAIFGVPEPRDDAAANAVRAAIEMRDALAAMNLRHEALGERQIQIGIGIETGMAIVGFIGSHLHQSYTAIGDPVNTASRLESATKAYPGCDILIGEQCERAQAHSGVAETVFVGQPELEGKEHKIAVYQVLGPRGLKAHP